MSNAYLGGLLLRRATSIARMRFSRQRRRHSKSSDRRRLRRRERHRSGRSRICSRLIRQPPNTFARLWIELDRTRAYSNLASIAGVLAEALYSTRPARRSVRVDCGCRAHSAVGRSRRTRSVDASSSEARCPTSRRGRRAQSGNERVRLAETTDALNRHAKARNDLAVVLRAAGRAEDARAAHAAALQMYEAKGNIVGAGEHA